MYRESRKVINRARWCNTHLSGVALLLFVRALGALRASVFSKET